MKVLAAVALFTVSKFGTAHAAKWEILPGYAVQSANLDDQTWTARIFDNSGPRYFDCVALLDAKPYPLTFNAYCNGGGFKSKLPASSNVKTMMNPSKDQSAKTLVFWQIDEVTGQAHVCFPTSSGITGDQCIDITPH
jgi:hypothetical protein